MNLDILTDNPIFVRELRRRMRGRGLILTMIIYVAAMCGLGYFTIMFKSQMLAANQSGYASVSDVGQALYYLIISIQVILVLIVAPSITAAMVKSEKEKLTFEFLKVTAISPAVYVVGALLSTVLYVALALFCALPVVTIAYLYGGVSDIVPLTVVLLAVSILLSSCGLLVSSVREKAKAGQGALAFIIVISAMMLIPQLIIGTFMRTGPMLNLTLYGLPLPYWVVVLVVCGTASGLVLLISARKFFDTAERALNYRQFAFLWFASLGLASLPIITPQMGLSGGPQEKLSVLLGIFLLLGIAMQNTMMLIRPEAGNERWRVKRRHPSLRSKDESLYYLIALTAAGGALVFAMINIIYPLAMGRWMALAPPLAYLFARAAWCRLGLKRIENPSTAFKVVSSLDIVFLPLPFIAASILGLTQNSASYEILSSFCPFYAYLQFLDPGNTAAAEIALASTTGIGIICWMADLGTKPRYDSADLRYELEA